HGVRAVHAPDRRRLQDLREERRERARVRRERRLTAYVDDDALARGDARELREELGDVARRERARMRGPRNVRVGLARQDVGVEGDRDGLVVLQDALRAAQALLELVHVVDDDEAL